FFPTHPAISEGSAEITYAKLNDQASRLATSLIDMGVRPGDHIGLCAPNSAEWIAFYFGVLKAGAVAVTFSSQLTGQELSHLLNHSVPKIMYTTPERLEDLEGFKGGGGLEKTVCADGDLDFKNLMSKGTGNFKAVDRDRTDTGVILYTGGTTGIPKGVMLTHENVNAAIQNIVFLERSTEKERALCFLPFNHVFGQMHILNATILSGGCLEMIPTFDLDQLLGLMSAGRVTKLFAVPTIYVRILSLDGLKEKLGSVRYCFSGAATLAAEVVRQWKDRSGLAIHEGYGMTEAAPLVAYNHYHRHVVGSVGTPAPGVEVKIRDREGRDVNQGEEGEICVRARNIMKGYLENPEATRNAFWEGGWFRTGDIGLFDKYGYLYIIDRLKDMIISGGENVYPREVEEMLFTSPDVEECAVIGIPDTEWGEVVTAVIVPKEGRQIDQQALKAYLKSNLSPFKVPKKYITVDELPKSPAGKILKRELKKQLLSP
ncbi:MAG: AMP-binding protein, partial [Deltaproteobacteria bacterium]|nr:AMP-binding protein [Deltaproteobacteria bacterium]